jgi:hypothetical protein
VSERLESVYAGVSRTGIKSDGMDCMYSHTRKRLSKILVQFRVMGPSLILVNRTHVIIRLGPRVYGTESLLSV